MISVFTPSHDTRYLNDCFASLKAQTHPDWEWVVALNGCAAWSCTDPRVRVLRAPETMRGIGALKWYACSAARGDILVELDHDDLLAPTCLAELCYAFDKHPAIGFAYSDTVRFRDDGQHPGNYSGAYGWMPAKLHGKGWLTCAWAPTPQALQRIWFAPDHVRAWRRSTYELVGGHDPALSICDDYDLILRTYLATDLLHLAEPLYYYRVGNNTSTGPRNAEIQVKQQALSDTYRERIAMTWASRQGLACVDLCSAGNAPPGYQGLDLRAGPGEVQADLSQRWPFADGEVGLIRAQDALEHLPDKLHTMAEAHRVLAHGGFLLSDTPSSDGRGADMDPTHVSRWNQNSFWYWTRDASRRYVPGAPRFQAWHLSTLHYDDWHKRHEISYVRAHLSAIKDGPRLPGAYDLEACYCG